MIEPHLLLKVLPMFAGLSDQAINLICCDLIEVEVSAGEVVTAIGDKEDVLYIVQTGTLSVSIEESHSGDLINVATLEENAHFGEMSLLTGQRRSAEIRAETNCTLYKLEKTVMAHLFKEYPESLRHLCHTMATRKASNKKTESADAAAAGAIASEALIKNVKKSFGLI